MYNVNISASSIIVFPFCRYQEQNSGIHLRFTLGYSNALMLSHYYVPTINNSVYHSYTRNKKQQCASYVYQKHIMCVQETTVCIIRVLETSHMCTRNNSVHYLCSRNMSFVYMKQQCVLSVYQKHVMCVQETTVCIMCVLTTCYVCT